MSSSLLRSDDEVDEARANIFSALGEPTRLSIFQVVAASEDGISVTGICDEVGIEPNLASHHLGCLRSCQLVEAERDGRSRLYRVSRPEAVEMVRLADDCIKSDVEEVLGCRVVSDGDDG